MCKRCRCTHRLYKLLLLLPWRRSKFSSCYRRSDLMSQRVETSARELVLTRSSQPENGHLRKNTSCLPMVGGSLRVLRLLPPLKLVAMI
jgi:hypothetical protein